MKISIVTLSFNQQAYLQKAMESVLSQGYHDLEYILVDPGSTDGSRELIKSYGHRIAQTIFEPDDGAADGLNKGFALATGSVYGFLNADDVFMPGAIQVVADFFRDHPDCALALGNGYIIDGTGQRIRHWKARGFSVRRYLYGGAQWLQQSTFFRADTYLRSPRFNTENRTCWDGELFVSMADQGAKIGYINADLAEFRIHNASISGSGHNQKQYRVDRRRIFRQIRGHDWTAIDEAVRFAYRVEGFLIRTAARFLDFAKKGGSA